MKAPLMVRKTILGLRQRPMQVGAFSCNVIRLFDNELGLTPELAMTAFTSKADKRIAKLQRKSRTQVDDDTKAPSTSAVAVEVHKVC